MAAATPLRSWKKPTRMRLAGFRTIDFEANMNRLMEFVSLRPRTPVAWRAPCDEARCSIGLAAALAALPCRAGFAHAPDSTP
jgi:hypothetical protein